MAYKEDDIVMAKTFSLQRKIPAQPMLVSLYHKGTNNLGEWAVRLWATGPHAYLIDRIKFKKVDKGDFFCDADSWISGDRQWLDGPTFIC